MKYSWMEKNPLDLIDGGELGRKFTAVNNVCEGNTGWNLKGKCR